MDTMDIIFHGQDRHSKKSAGIFRGDWVNESSLTGTRKSVQAIISLIFNLTEYISILSIF